ncbi:hypothetical protein ACB381_18455 [Klebsiella michiganensis]|uniref:hypothetical protein n=1 Tax=Klebsiella TaxID=570 RepID=UPI00064996B0|nr:MULTISPECIES: hypothetical protein [Klebsiella]AKL03879.1 hypothetical protein AB184_00975 [Klebsiella oxytoca]AKL20899.1 hypothetical protein AB181_01740 [Klebsiella oxytoca]APB48245.1 hypothetical protein AGF18_30210 [Klebsiella oxytoca]ELK6574866.1 hypothetical protein [Klebsiella michiganensis]MDK9842025.1 hypothetical protein [Klebsiella michiganensis]
MITIECTGTRPGINWFTPGKTYSGYSDADGQAIHTKDDLGRDAFVFINASLHGTFREIKSQSIESPVVRQRNTVMAEAFANCGM